MDYKYRIGQAVQVRKDLGNSRHYYMRSGPGAGTATDITTALMDSFAGRLVHIKAYSHDKYIIEEVSEVCLYWTDEMFEGANCIFHGLI